MAGKKPWCAEGVCSPAVPMHTKGCARRAAFVEIKKPVPADLDLPDWVKETRAKYVSQLKASLDFPLVATEPGANHFSHYLPKPPQDVCRSAENYHITGCPSASAKRIAAEAAPVVEKKPWWKRVFGV